MIVPIDLLSARLGTQLLTLGRVNRAARPWLGVYSAENGGRIVIADVSEDGPAALAGLRFRRHHRLGAGFQRGDPERILSRDLELRPPAGTEIPIEIIRDKRSLWVRVKSADRASFLKKPRLQLKGRRCLLGDFRPENF